MPVPTVHRDLGPPQVTVSSGWVSAAACRGLNPDLFHGDAAADAQAVAVCAGCPVRQECLDTALVTEGRHPVGVRGGLTAAERDPLRGAVVCPDCGRRLGSPQSLGTHRWRAHGRTAVCGTPPGVGRHRRLGQAVCPACRAAATAAQAQRRARAAGPGR